MRTFRQDLEEYIEIVRSDENKQKYSKDYINGALDGLDWVLARVELYGIDYTDN